MSDHWYTREGAPCYEQQTQKGGLRPTDLRDARKHGLVPSVTTVLQVIDKPALARWKVQQGILAALTLPRVDGEDDDAFLSRVMEDSQQQAKDAADEGTRIHDQIERAFKGQSVIEDYRPHVDAVRERLAEVFPDVTDWVAEASFAHPLGFGGKVDLHSPSTGIVVDFKGKDGDFSDGKRLAYDQHYQLAGYQIGLRFLDPGVACNIFVSRTHPGKVAHHVWTREDMGHAAQVFIGALRLWKLLKRFDPGFDDELDQAA